MAPAAARVTGGSLRPTRYAPPRLSALKWILRHHTVRTERLDHFVIFGERHLRHLLKQFMGHYLTERYHQGIGSQLIRPSAAPSNDNAPLGAVRCRSRLGGVLNYYCRNAA